MIEHDQSCKTVREKACGKLKFIGRKSDTKKITFAFLFFLVKKKAFQYIADIRNLNEIEIFNKNMLWMQITDSSY